MAWRVEAYRLMVQSGIRKIGSSRAMVRSVLHIAQ